MCSFKTSIVVNDNGFFAETIVYFSHLYHFIFFNNNETFSKTEIFFAVQITKRKLTLMVKGIYVFDVTLDYC